MFDFKTVLKWAVIGTLGVVGVAVLIYFVFLRFILPGLTEQVDNYNALAIMIVTAVPAVALITVLLVMPNWIIRVFSNEPYTVVDGMMPLLSDFKAYRQYVDLTSDEYTVENGYSGFATAFVKFMGMCLLLFPILLYLEVFGWGLFIYLNEGMFMFTIVHIVWILCGLALYSGCVGVRTICLGIQNFSLNPFIRSFNPKSLVVAPCIIPIVSFIYLLVALVLVLVGQQISVGILNIIGFVGVPLINPFLSIYQTHRAVADSKITVDDQRRKNGEPPMIW